MYRKERAAGGDFDAGIRVGLARILTSPSFLFRSEQSPAALPVGAAHQDQRARAGEPAVLLPLEQHPGRRAAEPGDCGTAACAGRARRAGAPHDRRPARRRDDERVHRPVAAAAESRQGDSGHPAVHRLRRQREAGDAPGDRALLRQRRPREPLRARPAERRLHVRERAARAALRHPRHLRHALPPRADDRTRTAAVCSARPAC